ncbi:MAG TPA: tetraacyldisaccharide 4'-kinase [Bacteroidales bacterium]|nr:tetraacyldisaccharide 4'-kinase [Bacteroidales bacterium]
MGNGRILLYPLSLIYGLVTVIRNFLYNTGILPSVEFRLPVICVGNITVGGTGKTPHAEYLAGLLRENFKVAVLSRGYKRTSSGFRVVTTSSTVAESGDEPLQISRKYPDVLVAVDRNRVKGVRRIMELHPETEVIILDDAFQHRRITPGFSILLSDFNRPVISDHMLPYGNLRESISNMRRADIILITKSPVNINPIQRRLIVKEINKAPYQNLYFTSIKYNPPVPLFDRKESSGPIPDLKKLNGTGVVLITGIANPIPLKEYLQETAGEIIHLRYPDHYTFREKDLNAVYNAFDQLKTALKFVLTTEKDSVRLKEFTNIAEPIRSAFYYIPVGICFLNDDTAEFNKLIIEYVRKNKRNNRVSEI